jgi:hypothetical protein
LLTWAWCKAGLPFCARQFFRRVARVNTVALAELVLLIARPSELFDSSYQLSILAAGVIAGLAVPWVDPSSSRYHRAVEDLGDVTRDRLPSPRATQFRLDLRAAANALAKKVPRRAAAHADLFLTLPVRRGLRLWDFFVLSFCTQIASASDLRGVVSDDSVVMRIGFGGVHVLLTGDAERRVEDTLIDEHEPLQADFLKVPHHDHESKTSSSEEFLKAVGPCVAVVSVGLGNSYGQPNAATVQRYINLGIPLFARTTTEQSLF